jgi:hypothetical protein
MKKINWLQHIESQKQSNLNVKDYCRLNHLKASNFYAARKNQAEHAQFIPLVVKEKLEKPLFELTLSAQAEGVVEFKGTTNKPELLTSLLLRVAA